MVTEMLSPDREVSSMTSSSALGNGTGAGAGGGAGAERRPGVVDLEPPPPPPPYEETEDDERGMSRPAM